MASKSPAVAAHTPSCPPLPPGPIDFDTLVAQSKLGADLEVVAAAMVSGEPIPAVASNSSGNAPETPSTPE